MDHRAADFAGVATSPNEVLLVRDAAVLTLVDRSDSGSLLSGIFRKAGGGNSGVVLALPSCAVPTPSHLSQHERVLRIRFLYGEPWFCLASVLAREKETGRGFDENHWNGNDCKVFEILSTSLYHPYLVDVFRH
jgi:hypothetical protein